MSPPRETDAETETVVETFATRFLDRSFDEATDMLSEAGREAVVESFPEAFGEEEMDATDVLDRYRRGLHSQYGDARGVGAVDGATDGERTTVELTFEAGSERASVGVADGTVTDLSFDPEYEIPEYADADAFAEREVDVDAGDVSLDGVLAVPDGDGPHPGVVLVHGAGIHDPDGTAGASKILKDLAWGLASAGVATLRYEKRLAAHDVEDEEFTLDRVVVDDALAALGELADAEAVRENALFVVGHSQGGMAAPRIAERHGGLAGAVVLDALADPVHDPDDLAFIRYEMEPDGDLDERQERELERERETVRRLAEGEYEDDETLWGRPGTWHRSVRNCDPAGTASRLEAPTFVLKTGRADEETQAELRAWFRREFENWRDVDLPAGSRVEFYGDLDHYFQDGFTPADPMGLHFGGNVAEYVVADLVAWVEERLGRHPTTSDR